MHALCIFLFGCLSFILFRLFSTFDAHADEKLGARASRKEQAARSPAVPESWVCLRHLR